MDQRIPSMVFKDTVVLHLGTSDALNAPSDGQCILNTYRSLRNIERNHSRSHRSVPLMVCLVPSTSKRKGQQRVEMLNHLYKRRCEDSQHLHFVETGCSAIDLTEDGVHLEKSGKVEVANAILQYGAGFQQSRCSQKSLDIIRHKQSCNSEQSHEQVTENKIVVNAEQSPPRIQSPCNRQLTLDHIVVNCARTDEIPCNLRNNDVDNAINSHIFQSLIKVFV